MNIELPPLETDDERRARHLRMLRRLGDLCMAVAEDASERVQADRAAGVDPIQSGAAMVVARMASTVRQVIGMECRIAAGTAGLTPTPRLSERRGSSDARVAVIRDVLERAPARDGAEPVARDAGWQVRVDEAMESEDLLAALDADAQTDPLEAEVTLFAAIEAAAERLGVVVDVRCLSGEAMRVLTPTLWERLSAEAARGPPGS